MSTDFRYRVFFAIPFDPATLSMYEEIAHEKLQARIQERFEFVSGDQAFIYEEVRNQGVETSHRSIDMEAFKRQNVDLYTRFQRQIASSDIIIADLTNNNPNVHLELGIALSMNKNILRVSGRDLVHRASDIGGLFIERYHKQDQLVEQIERYLREFLAIKELRLEPGRPFYKNHFLPVLDSPFQGSLVPNYERLRSMRDGELKVRFALSSKDENEGWFGAYFRYRYSDAPWLGGYLVNVRQNGWLRIPEKPAGGKPLQEEKYTPLSPNRFCTFHLEVDGNRLHAWLDDDSAGGVKVDDLKDQSCGNLAVACYWSNARFESIETVRRDTIEFPDCE